MRGSGDCATGTKGPLLGTIRPTSGTAPYFVQGNAAIRAARPRHDNAGSTAGNWVAIDIYVEQGPAEVAGGGDPVDPNRQLGKQVHLPILNFQGQDDVCRTWIEVQVIGREFAKAVLVTWGEPGFCPPQCAGPLKVECTGLLKPGSTWNFLGSQVPDGLEGRHALQVHGRADREIDSTFGGEDDIVADYMCETLFFGVVGDCDDWRRFKKAYNEGLEFAGLNMAHGQRRWLLAVDVLRHCPGDVTPGVDVSSKYNGIAGDHLGAFDPVYGGYASTCRCCTRTRPASTA